MQKSIRALAVLSLAIPIASPVAQADELSDAIPAKAKAAVFVKSIKGLSDGAKAFGEAAALPVPLDLMPKIESAFPAGVIEVDRPAAIALVGAGMHEAVGILPVANADDAIKKLKGQAKGDVFQLDISGATTFAIAKDKWLVVSDKEEALAAFKAGPAKFAAADAKSAAAMRSAHLVTVVLNMQELRPIAEGGLGAAEAFIPFIAQQQAAAGADPEATKRQFETMLKAARSLVADSAGLSLGFSAEAGKAEFDAALDLAPDSPSAKMFAGGKSSDVAPFQGMPADPFVMAFYQDVTQSPGIMELGQQMMGIHGAKVDEQLKADMKRMMETSLAQSFIMGVGAKNTGIGMLGRYYTSDPAGYMKLLPRMTELTSKMAGQGKIKVKTSTQQIGGVEVVETEMEFEGLPEQQAEMMKKIYGGAMKIQAYKIDDRSIGWGMNVAPDLPTKLKASGGFAEEGRIAKVLSALPQKPILIGLIDPFGGLRLLGAMRGAIPLPLPEFKLPETSPPPFGFAMARSDGGVTARIHVRPETVAEIVKLAGAQ